MAYDNTNRGSLFKNSRKKTAADPEYNGNIDINGTKHNIIATSKVAGPKSKKAGEKFFAISFVEEDFVEEDVFETPNKAGSGVLFKNAKCTEENRQPNYRGSIEHGGVDYWLSAWLKEFGEHTSAPGTKFLSMSIQPKDQPNSTAGSKAFQSAEAKIKRMQEGADPSQFKLPKEKGFDDFDDDIPF